MIDDAYIDVDGGYGDDGKQTRAHLVLIGDFVEECEHYLANDNASSIVLRIPRDAIERLRESIDAVL